MRLSPRTWGKLTLGALIIGGVLVTLWATNRPTVDSTAARPTPTATPPLLRAARAAIVVRDGAVRRATISCDGADRTASGFWAGAERQACEALASTRAALLSGPGCRTGTGTRLRVTGRFGDRRFDHRTRRSACDGWLSVNVLAGPVLKPDQELEQPSG
jgi:hypothetical protein